MSTIAGEDVLEIVIAGIIVVVLGSALAPLLPFNLVPLGWLLVMLGIAVGVGVLVLALATTLGGLGAR